jgi:hypothetical protein
MPFRGVVTNVIASQDADEICEYHRCQNQLIDGSIDLCQA